LPLPHSGVGVVHLNSVLGPGHLSLACHMHVFSIYVPRGDRATSSFGLLCPVGIRKSAHGQHDPLVWLDY